MVWMDAASLAARTSARRWTCRSNVSADALGAHRESAFVCEAHLRQPLHLLLARHVERGDLRLALIRAARKGDAALRQLLLLHLFVDRALVVIHVVEIGPALGLLAHKLQWLVDVGIV